MLDLIFALLACFLIIGLLFSSVAPEVTVGFFRDKSLHNRQFAVLFYLGLLFMYGLINFGLTALIR